MVLPLEAHLVRKRHLLRLVRVWILIKCILLRDVLLVLVLILLHLRLLVVLTFCVYHPDAAQSTGGQCRLDGVQIDDPRFLVLLGLLSSAVPEGGEHTAVVVVSGHLINVCFISYTQRVAVYWRDWFILSLILCHRLMVHRVEHFFAECGVLLHLFIFILLCLVSI